MRSIPFKLLVVISVASSVFGCSTKNNEEKTADSAEPAYVGKEVKYATDSTDMVGYLAYDENATEKRPGILVIHEWWGHNAYTRERADMLAKLGYVALAIDMYGEGKVAAHPEDAGKFMMSVFSNMDEGEARFDKALELLKAHPKTAPDKVGVIGYCFGGSVALTMANMGKELDAVAAFHSGVELPVMPQEGIKAKILVCNGAADPFISEASVEKFKTAMDSVHANYTYIAYDSAMHAFTSKAADEMGQKFGLPLAYNEAADQQSWEEMKKLFAKVLSP